MMKSSVPSAVESKIERSTVDLKELLSLRIDLRHLICWIEHDRSLNACKGKLDILKGQLRDAENQIRVIQDPTEKKTYSRSASSDYPGTRLKRTT